jgi:hypothetical protein
MMRTSREEHRANFVVDMRMFTITHPSLVAIKITSDVVCSDLTIDPHLALQALASI